MFGFANKHEVIELRNEIDRMKRKQACDSGYHDWILQHSGGLHVVCQHCYKPAKPEQYNRYVVDAPKEEPKKK